jgi:hypothetical protein
MEVDVEVLDVTEEEARKLLLTIDPLAALAETQEQLRRRLLEQTPTDNDALAAAWEAAAAEVLERETEPVGAIAEQFLILVRARMRNSRWNCWGGLARRGWSVGR